MYNHFTSGSHTAWSSSQFASDGPPISGSSSSSLAMALDESAMQIRRSVKQEEPAQQTPTYAFGPSYPSFAMPENPEHGDHCTIRRTPFTFSEPATNWIPNDMCFPETAYEPQYAAMYGKQVSTPPDEYSQLGPYQETRADCSTIDGSMSGLAYVDEYNTLSTHDPNAYAFDFPISPTQDEPIVFPAPPTAAQISRSSTLADAMTLPLALRTPQPPPPPSPSTPVLSPMGLTPKIEPTDAVLSTPVAPPAITDPSPEISVPVSRPHEPSIKTEPSMSTAPTTIASATTPETRVDAPPKKRSSKSTGRPRGRPPKSLLTSVPRDKVAMSSNVEPTAAAETGTSDEKSCPQMGDASQDDHADDEHPGQSTFMLDTAVPEPPKKKPIMACLFCRERKIGCGPPPPEQEDQTCKQCKRRGLICEWPTECRRGQHKRGPRKKRDAAALEEGDAAVPDAAGPSSSDTAPKPKRKAEPKASAEELKRQKAAVDVQAVTERHTALKRQRKLAAAQHKRLVEMRVIDA